MRLICLDTSVLIAIEKGKVAIQHLAEKLPDAGFVVTVVSVFEQAYGAYSLIGKGFVGKGEAILDALKDFKILSLASESAFLAAKISAELAAQGTAIESSDVFIGAICIHDSLDLLTVNAKHFHPLAAYGLAIHDLSHLG